MNFRKGDFITQNSLSSVIAVYEGELYSVTDNDTEKYYSLLAYYNPVNYDMDEKQEWVRKPILEYTLDDEKVCDYGIEQNDIKEWRLCNDFEIRSFLKMLIEKEHVAWDNAKCKFTTMASGLTNLNPFYMGGSTQSKPYNKQDDKTKKQITRFVKEDWEQKTPISTMTLSRHKLIEEQCIKLKFSFNEYGYERTYYGGTYQQGGYPHTAFCGYDEDEYWGV